jgi:hypothetical protein
MIDQQTKCRAHAQRHAQKPTHSLCAPSRPYATRRAGNVCRAKHDTGFLDSIEQTFELGGAENPEIVRRLRTVAFLYLSPD